MQNSFGGYKRFRSDDDKGFDKKRGIKDKEGGNDRKGKNGNFGGAEKKQHKKRKASATPLSRYDERTKDKLEIGRELGGSSKRAKKEGRNHAGKFNKRPKKSSKQIEREIKFARKYHAIKFFDRQKTERKLRTVVNKLKKAPAAAHAAAKAASQHHRNEAKSQAKAKGDDANVEGKTKVEEENCSDSDLDSNNNIADVEVKEKVQEGSSSDSGSGDSNSIAGEQGEWAGLFKERAKLLDDLRYIRYFPRGQKYISLFTMNATSAVAVNMKEHRVFALMMAKKTQRGTDQFLLGFLNRMEEKKKDATQMEDADDEETKVESKRKSQKLKSKTKIQGGESEPDASDNAEDDDEEDDFFA